MRDAWIHMILRYMKTAFAAFDGLMISRKAWTSLSLAEAKAQERPKPKTRPPLPPVVAAPKVAQVGCGAP